MSLIDDGSQAGLYPDCTYHANRDIIVWVFTTLIHGIARCAY